MSDREPDSGAGRRRALCVKLVDQIRRRGQLSADELTEFAGRLLEGYTRDLLDELLPDGSGPDGPVPEGPVPEGPFPEGPFDVLHHDAWVKRQFNEGLDRAGAALREVLRESDYRHAVAQVLQRKMFEAEGTLRQALKARALEHSAVTFS
jgi:hypothetical protein